jgi:aryl-alcohol dehydrogenase-like predicted oxidoreductase
METRRFGSAGLISSAIGLGTAAFTGVYGSVTKRECARAIQLALDLGITMLDTADFYANGEIERLVGESVSGRRDDALIVTQGGAITSTAGEVISIDGSPSYLAKACDASLARLSTECIDLYYLYRVDPRVQVEESIGKLADLVAAGKIRYLGLCESSADDLRRAQAVHPISALAVEYSLRHRSAENGPLPTAAELGVGVVAYCPLARGLLTGSAAAAAPAHEQVAWRAIEAQAAELDLGISRLALGWLLAWRADTIPVPSTRSLAHLEMNASAPEIRLTPDTSLRLAEVFAP